MKMIARILPLLLVALPVAAQSMPSSLTDSWKALSFLQGTWEAEGHRRPRRFSNGHSWGHAKCTVNLDEVVGEIIKGNCPRMIFQLASIFAPGLIEWA